MAPGDATPGKCSDDFGRHLSRRGGACPHHLRNNLMSFGSIVSIRTCPQTAPILRRSGPVGLRYGVSALEEVSCGTFWSGRDVPAFHAAAMTARPAKPISARQ